MVQAATAMGAGLMSDDDLIKRGDAKAACAPHYQITLDDLPAVSAPVAVRVKPLTWDHDHLPGWVFARGGVLSYSIMLSAHRVYGVPGEHDGAAQFPTLEAAKAAAQADYAARIMAAIDAPDVAELVEALRLLLQVNDGVPMLGIEASRRIEKARAAQADYAARIMAAIDAPAWKGNAAFCDSLRSVPENAFKYDPAPEAPDAAELSADKEDFLAWLDSLPQEPNDKLKAAYAAYKAHVKPAPDVAELVEALRHCVGLLDGLVAESGRSIEWGEEDPFRMGEWFEADDLAKIKRARAALTTENPNG